MKILLTGSHGLVGTALTQELAHGGHTVVRLIRFGAGVKQGEASNHGTAAPTTGQILDVHWNPRTCDLEGDPFGDQRENVEGADAIVNLAGASIAEQSWSAERKALLRSSRVQFTREMVCALEKLNTPPRALLSASAIGYYGDRGEEMLTEASGPGHDFLARLAQEWEAEAVKAETIGMAVARLRFGIILAKHGGALPQMIKPLRFGVGRIGSGRHWMSWIMLVDVVRAISFVLERGITGAVNVVAPNPVRNFEFAEQLASLLHRRAFLPAPAFALEFALGEMARELLLASQRVMPTHLQRLGFQFLYPQLASALQTLELRDRLVNA